jgi:hypothetical protein
MSEYLNIKSAASYCGYNSKYFSRVCESFAVPRYGPKRNRFKKSDLDAWMRDPRMFQQIINEFRNGFKGVVI